MPRQRFTSEQIIGKLREVEVPGDVGCGHAGARRTWRRPVWPYAVQTYEIADWAAPPLIWRRRSGSPASPPN